MNGTDTRKKSLTGVKIKRGIFQGDALSSLLSVIAMMPLNHILRKCKGGYKPHNSHEKGKHLIYDIRLFAKNEKELEIFIQVVRIYSEDIGMEFGIEKMRHVHNEKEKTIYDGRNRSTKSR